MKKSLHFKSEFTAIKMVKSFVLVGAAKQTLFNGK